MDWRRIVRLFAIAVCLAVLVVWPLAVAFLGGGRW